jgi:integrase family protein with SAM-like domain
MPESPLAKTQIELSTGVPSGKQNYLEAKIADAKLGLEAKIERLLAEGRVRMGLIDRMPEWLKNSVNSAADLDGVMRACHAIQTRKQPPPPSEAPNAQGLDVRSQLPIPAFIDEFIAKLGNKARSTLLGHRSTLNKLARITGVTPISATTAIHCRDLVDRLEKDGLSKASINKAITQTRLFFHWAMRRMLIAADRGRCFHLQDRA